MFCFCQRSHPLPHLSHWPHMMSLMSFSPSFPQNRRTKTGYRVCVSACTVSCVCVCVCVCVYASVCVYVSLCQMFPPWRDFTAPLASCSSSPSPSFTVPRWLEGATHMHRYARTQGQSEAQSYIYTLACKGREWHFLTDARIVQGYAYISSNVDKD